MGWWCVPLPRSLLFCSCISVCGNLSLCSLGQQVPSGGTITYVSLGDGGCLSGTASISTWCIQSGAPPSTVSVCACMSWARVQGWEPKFRAKPALPPGDVPGEHSLQNSTRGFASPYPCAGGTLVPAFHVGLQLCRSHCTCAQFVSHLHSSGCLLPIKKGGHVVGS